MKTGNRLGALLLAAAMVFSLLPAAALAADEAVMAETPLGEETAALAEVPEAAEEPSAPAELAATTAAPTPGMKEQSSNGLTVSFVKYTGYEGFGDTRIEVEKDDLTLVAAKIQWTAADGATGYTVTVSSTDDTRTFTNTGDDRCVWQQDDTARTARITNLYPGKTYTVTVTAQGTAASGSMTFTTKTATNALAEIAAADPEAPAAYGALPDDNQLKYHDSELAAFIHYGPNTFNNRSWGTGNESPSDFAPTALNQDVVDGWVEQFKAAGFRRLIFVAKHHDGFCLWFSAYTEHDLDADTSGYHYDLLEQVSKACTKYDMDMGFYISPWDAHEEHHGVYGTEAYNTLYFNTLREVLDSKANGNKYGNNGKFVEVWMDGAKGSSVQQSNDFDTWFQLIHELQPECAVFSPRGDGGIRWVGNEEGYSGSNEEKNGKGDISWQKVDPANKIVSGTLTHNICDPHEGNKGTREQWERQYGKPDGVLWSVNECDVSIESEWFWHSGNTLRTMDALSSMYFESVGYGSPFLLNVPPTTEGPFAAASANRLAEFGREVKNSFANDLAAGKTAIAGSTRTSATAGKFGAANVVDDDPDNYWTMDDAAWTAWKTSSKTPGAEGSASVTVELGGVKTFDVISVQEFIPLGQRIISGVAEYRDEAGNWQEFGTFHTVGARRLIRAEPVNGDAVRVTITDSYAVPLLRSIGVYKVTRAMALGDGLPAGLTYVDDQAEGQIQYSSSGWTKKADDSTSINKTKTYAQGAASFTYTFTGSKIYVMGIKDPNNGKFEVKIDEGEWTEVNTADTTARITKTVLWASEDLAAGEHTISVKWKSGWFDFDGLCYLPGSASVLEFEKAEYTVFPSSSVDLKVKRSGDTSGTVTVKYSVAPGTAIQGDYIQKGGNMTFAAGETEKIVTMEATAGAQSNSPFGKNFYCVMADPEGAILGFNSEASITIVDPDTVPQEPRGETYTADDPFQFPAAAGKSRKLEGEYMVLDGSEAAADSYVRVSTDSNASNGKKIGWFEPGNKVTLHYNAPRAGVYTVTLRYQSGRPTDNTNDNKVNWRGENVEDFSGTIPGLGGNGSNYGEYSYQLTVTEAGEGSIEFYADASACPNIDWITFRLNDAEIPGEIVTEGLVGHWTFDGDTREEKLTSKATDRLTAAMANGVSLVDSDLNGGSGGGVQFDGSNAAYLTLNLTGDNALTTARSFSVGAWIKHTDWATSTSSQQIPSVFHSGGGQAILAFQHNNAETGRFSSYLGGTNTFDTRDIKLNTWCHVMLVYTKDGDTSSICFYVNGVASEATNVPVPNFNVSGANADLVGKILVGAHRNGSEPSVKAVMDEVRYYNRAITADEVKAIYEKDKPTVPPLTVTVDPETEVRQITPAMFGINHRYHNDGYGSWDKENAKIYDAFQTLCEQAGFGSVRYPGGTVANLFTWKDAIGPVADRTPTIAGNNFYTRANQAEVGGADPVDPVFGVDEAMTWIYDDLNAEAIFVYGLGRGNPADAAELVEYLNAPATEEYPWAMKRAENGHPEPYGVTKFEIGNEFSDVGQRYWMEGKPSGANDVDLYIDGGIMTIDGTRNQYNGNPLNYVVRKGDWRPLASKSKGEANEVYYVCYTPVVADSAHVKVDGTEWNIVASLEDQTADAQVCTFDDATGEIRFGDGTHGAIPARDARITCDYQTRQAGFVDYYDAMKAVAADIGVEIEIYSGIVDRQQQSFISKMNEKGFNDKYDGVIYHPYSGGGQCSYAASLTKEKEYAATIGTLKRAMDATGDTTKEVAVSEFGINANNDYVASMGNAIYTANHLIDCVNAGAAYLNRHCLVDFTTGDNLGNWQQSVIQCHRQSDGTYRYVATPSAHVFQLFNTMTGNVEVDQTVTGNADYIGATVQTVNVYSTKDADGNVYVLVVNNDENNETAVQIGVKDTSLSGKTIQVKYLTSNAVLDQNTLAEPDKVRVQTAQVEVAEDTVLSYTMKPHSVYAFQIPDAAQPAVRNVVSVASATATGTVGTAFDRLTLPATVTVTLSDNSTAELAVTWDGSSYDPQTTAAQTLTGTLTMGDNMLNPGNVTASLTLTLTGGTVTPSRPSGSSSTSDPAAETRFEDVPEGHWAAEAIHRIAALKLVEGIADNQYDMVSPMTRGALATVLHRLSQGKNDYEVTFKDVAEGRYYTDGVAWAANTGVVTGYTDEIFAPDDIITREQLAVMLCRYAKLIGMDTKAKPQALDQFADGDSAGDWAVNGVAWCVENGILKGKGNNTLAPTADVTRAEVAVMLDRFIALLK